MYWSIDALVSRFPIFLFGIVSYFYFNKEIKTKYIIIEILFCLCFALAYKLLPIHMNSFAYNACVTPIMIIIFLVIMIFFKKIPDLYSAFEWVGKSSLEFYVANTIVVNCMSIPNLLPDNIVFKYVLYYGSHIIIVWAIIPLNNYLCNNLKKVFHI